MEKIILFIQNWYKNLSGDQKKKLILFCTAVFAMILTLSVLISISSGLNSNSASRREERQSIITPIPAESIFLPEEPDFIPGVLLERGQRSSWTLEDASEYWQDPLRSGEEAWRDKIEKAIDEILERVP